MYNALSALNGEKQEGVVTVEEMGLIGMITLRGDFEDENFAAAVSHFSGLAIPDVRQVDRGEKMSIAWMSPDELLLVLPYYQAEGLVAEITEALGETFALVVDVSDARTMFRISGPFANEALAKLAPVDLSDEAFPVGSVRRTRMAQVAAAFWRTDETGYMVICFRSVADYVWGLMTNAVDDGPVGVFSKDT